MLDRILHNHKPSSADKEDCLSCRLIGGGGLSCLGFYVLYKTYSGRQSMSKWSVMASAGLGSVILSIASMRLLGIDFNSFQFKDKPNHKN